MLKRAVSGHDKTALDKLHATYSSHIKHYIASRIRSIADAEDLTQNVFLELCAGNSRYDGQSDVQAYLLGIARNSVGRYYRDKNKQLQAVKVETDRIRLVGCNNFVPPPALSREELLRRVERAMDQLSPKAREALKARLIDGLSSREAAQKVGCSLEAFYKRLDTALKSLEKMRCRGVLNIEETRTPINTEK